MFEQKCKHKILYFSSSGIGSGSSHSPTSSASPSQRSFNEMNDTHYTNTSSYSLRSAINSSSSSSYKNDSQQQHSAYLRLNGSRGCANDYRVIALDARPKPGRLEDFVPEIERKTSINSFEPSNMKKPAPSTTPRIQTVTQKYSSPQPYKSPQLDNNNNKFEVRFPTMQQQQQRSLGFSANRMLRRDFGVDQTTTVEDSFSNPTNETETESKKISVVNIQSIAFFLRLFLFYTIPTFLKF